MSNYNYRPPMDLGEAMAHLFAARRAVDSIKREGADAQPRIKAGFCACGRRISYNKSQCLACKERQDAIPKI